MLTLLKLMIQLHYHFQHCNVEKTQETWFSAFWHSIFTGILQRQLNSLSVLQ